VNSVRRLIGFYGNLGTGTMSKKTSGKKSTQSTAGKDKRIQALHKLNGDYLKAVMAEKEAKKRGLT
jgi:hypothetical protein